MSQSLKEEHRHFVRHPFPGVVISNELNIGDVGIIAAITNEVVAGSTVYSFEGFTAAGNFHPWRTMIVEPALVVIRSRFHATGIHTTIQAFME